jgi:hypothetical protein
MEIIKIEREAIVLDAAEKAKLKYCLDYCCHRLMAHRGTGLHKIKGLPEFVEYMRKQLS